MNGIFYSNGFYGDWLFYGGCLGALGVAITCHLYGKKLGGTDRLTWKHNLVIISIFAFPGVILPLILTPSLSVKNKILTVSGLIAFGIARYFASTRAYKK